MAAMTTPASRPATSRRDRIDRRQVMARDRVHDRGGGDRDRQSPDAADHRPPSCASAAPSAGGATRFAVSIASSSALPERAARRELRAARDADRDAGEVRAAIELAVKVAVAVRARRAQREPRRAHRHAHQHRPRVAVALAVKAGRVLADPAEADRADAPVGAQALEQPPRQARVREREEVRRDRRARTAGRVDGLAGAALHALHEIARAVERAGLETARPAFEQRAAIDAGHRRVQPDRAGDRGDVRRPGLARVGLDQAGGRAVQALGERRGQPIVQRRVGRRRIHRAQHAERQVDVAEVRVALAGRHRRRGRCGPRPASPSAACAGR